MQCVDATRGCYGQRSVALSAAHLIEILRNLSVPVVIVSGYPAPKEEEFRGAPWLTKPVMPEDLLSAIDKAMGNKEPA